MENKHKYGITSNANYNHIIDIITDFAFLFLSRTVGDGERNRLGQTVKEIISTPSQGGGFLGFKRR